MMLHTKNQGAMTRGFRQEDRFFLHVSLYISLCKTFDHEAGPCWPRGGNFYKFGRVPLDIATYQLSRL